MNDKKDTWQLASPDDGPDEILHNAKWANIFITEDGKHYGCISKTYDSLEELMNAEQILPDPCKKCGGPVSTDYQDNKSMIERNFCFSCNFWTDKLEDIKKDNVCVINGTLYSIADEKTGGRSEFRGFGGRRFVLEKNGIKITTTNLWRGGDVPTRFKDQFPDNAKFMQS